MSQPLLVLPPDSDNYAVADGAQYISAKLDGGLSRYRSDLLNAAATVTVQWTTMPAGYDYLRAFFRTALQQGVLPFSMYLTFDNSVTSIYSNCHFVPGTFGLKSQTGWTYVVGASVEVLPATANPVSDQAILDSFSSYYNANSNALGALAALVNTQIPYVLNP
jgi:hypothetical protein